MDSNEQSNEGMEMDMEMDSGSEGEKSRASNCVSGSLEGEKPQAQDSAEPAATECSAPSLQVGLEVTETIAISEEVKGANGEIGVLLASLKGEGSPTRNSVMDGRCILVCVGLFSYVLVICSLESQLKFMHCGNSFGVLLSFILKWEGGK
ncbi:hypothetical protein PIB30_119117 [Stylosanthes scabra]|uniref:Uncharacterized protein n=1 Tax=Stylosanthes scabra TaxID=79078 RepID=A0ABU6WA29_9FABA|nr:hypothetical protein [Stylosanthes scabra]